MNAFGIIAIIIAAAVLLLFVLPTIVLSYILYSILLVRTNPKKWGRECSIPEDEEYLRMFNIGIDWDKKYGDTKQNVSVVSDGFKLVGEYFDFGFDKAVIIIPGRMESLLYSYYFAEPFRRAGYNVLAIDNRSHGLSEGRICSLGFKEYRDIIKWSEFLHKEKSIKSVVLHGICIGASVALFALTSPNCPDYIDGMIAEGMYTTFSESFKNHMIADKRPLFPFFRATMWQIRVFSGANVVSDGPVKRIDRLKKPILFLHSKQDIFSTPEKAEILFEKCGSENKEIIWFDTGDHSRIRINHTERYDDCIVKFLKEKF